MSSTVTIPSLITISRILLVPVFSYLYLVEKFVPAVTVFVIAGATDALDGFIARRFRMRSRLGSLLDPAADKILMLAGLLLLSSDKHIPWYFTLLVVGRDVLISLGVGLLNLLRIRLLYKPTIVSKMATVSQMTVISLSFASVFLDQRPDLLPPIIIQMIHSLKFLILYVSIGLTSITFFQYGYLFYKFYRYGERKGES